MYSRTLKTIVSYWSIGWVLFWIFAIAVSPSLPSVELGYEIGPSQYMLAFIGSYLFWPYLLLYFICLLAGGV